MVKQRARWVVKKFWGTAAVLLISMAVVIQLGRFVSPMVSENRDRIAEYFSAQLGAEVSFGALDAVWDGLRPELMMSDFRLHDDTGVEVVYVKSAVAQIDLLKSFWDFSVRMWKVELDDVEVTFSQHNQRWGLAGVDVDTNENASSTDPLDVFLMGRLIRFDNIQVNFKFESGRRHQAILTSMLLQNDDGFHRLNARMGSSEHADILTLVYEGVGSPRNLDQFEGQGYLELNQFPLEDSLALGSEALAERSEIKGAELSAKLWASFRPEQGMSLAGDVEFQRAHNVNDGLLQSFSSQILARNLTQDDWQLSLSKASVSWADRDSPLLNLQLTTTDEDWILQLPQIDLGYWLGEVEKLPQVPDSVQGILTKLGTTGHLENFSMVIPRDEPRDFNLTANLVDVALNAWNGAPQIASLSGFVSASALSGFVEIDSPNAFFMHYPTVYHQGFHFQRAQGQVGWSVRPEDNQVTVNSGQLTMEGDLGVVNGYFYLDAPLQKYTRPTELVLQIGLQNGSADSHSALVPFVVPNSLTQWLDQSIKGGQVPSGSFVMQSYFGHNASDVRSVQVGLNLNNAQLQYDPHWPEIRSFDGYVEVDSPQVDGWIDRGRFLDTELQPSYIHVENHPSGTGSVLSVRAAVEGEASSGLAVLTDTPLRESFGDTLASWAMTGQLQARVDLEIPLASGLAGHRQQVDLSLTDVALEMRDLDLNFHRLNGHLSFNEREGLQAKEMTAELWQQPFSLGIESRITEDTGLSTDVSFDGALDFSALEKWSRRPELAFVEGVSPVKGVVSIGKHLPLIEGEPASLRLTLDSNLSASRVNLPAPFGKQADEKRSMRASIAVAPNSVAYEFDYNQQVAVALRQVKGQALRGRVALNQPDPAEPDQPGIWLSGVVERVDGEQWWPVIQRYQTVTDRWGSIAASESDGRPDLVSAAQAPAVELDLDLEHFVWGDFTLASVHIGGGQQADGWNIRIDDDVVTGEVVLREGQPIGLNARYIRWPEKSSGAVDDAISTRSEVAGAPVVGTGSDQVRVAVVPSDSGVASSSVNDWLHGLAPTDVMAMEVAIDELSLNGRDYGRWSFSVRPVEGAIRITQIEGAIRGLSVSALKEGDKGAELVWFSADEGSRSEFRGRLKGRNLADVSKAWLLPAMLDSKSAVVTLDMFWQGAPLDFTLMGASGNVSVAVKDGRFYRSTGQATSALLRLVGLFNFDSWVRRLQLDFSDVYKGGTPYEKIEGKIKLDRGTLYLVDPIEVINTSSRLQMGGTIKLDDETLDTSLVATLPVGGNVTLITALAAGLPAAAGVYAVSKIFKKQVEQVASVSYRVRGSWSAPEVTFDRLFDNRAAKDAAKDSRKDAASEAQIPVPSQ